MEEPKKMIPKGTYYPPHIWELVQQMVSEGFSPNAREYIRNAVINQLRVDFYTLKQRSVDEIKQKIK